MASFRNWKIFCIANNLTFNRHNSPKYDYEGQIRFYSPDSGDKIIGAIEDGEPYLKLSELKDYQERGLPLQEVIAKVAEYASNVPAFEF